MGAHTRRLVIRPLYSGESEAISEALRDQLDVDVYNWTILHWRGEARPRRGSLCRSKAATGCWQIEKRAEKHAVKAPAPLTSLGHHYWCVTRPPRLCAILWTLLLYPLFFYTAAFSISILSSFAQPNRPRPTETCRNLLVPRWGFVLTREGRNL